MNSDKDENDSTLWINTSLGFMFGSALLVSFSLIQKIIAGFDPFMLKGYIVPLIFGGATGAVLKVKCAKVRELNRRLSLRITKLESVIPICSHCKSVREAGKDPNNTDSWRTIEHYMSTKTSSRFSHGICPDCLAKIYPYVNTGKNPEKTEPKK